MKKRSRKQDTYKRRGHYDACVGVCWCEAHGLARNAS